MLFYKNENFAFKIGTLQFWNPNCLTMSSWSYTKKGMYE